ncbi:hypothetical protein [Cellulomonas fimi]|uniref:hypothetical protein n=1 Tax=Cellulomonas fimi TaxID=1708 RepID=UPI002359D697|nr:hypothetical protein [Cellulomonas fimi]
MSLVSVHNEWDPLEEVIVGTTVGARVPVGDRSMMSIEFPDVEGPQDIPSGPYDRRAVEEAQVELDALADSLRALGITVRRPQPRDHAVVASSPHWSTDSFPDVCPRDGFLTVGDTVIETPMSLRSRFFEYLAYKDLFIEYLRSGSRWISAPKPRLADDLFDPTAPVGRRVLDDEPTFDAANVLRIGTDLLYLVSDSGTELGLRWLQSTLGSQYKVHPVRDVYASTHIDTTFVPLRPGLVLLNSARVTEDNLPEIFRGWDLIWAEEPVDTHPPDRRPNGSVWVGMNLLSVSPDLVVADERQTSLVKQLESHGIDVLPARLTHSRTFGGGFHCVTLDVRRRGTLETYA